ncbi:GNAT family N-acetyltransferase [Vibrio fluvialis]|uniref:GNAT family N-acetyltransferase n=1 Tax=Vibrio fluvialis TaxID=676 RepID=UPI001F2BDAFC|nr:N-acetyltransferase [Vibrio fluvialis]MCE7648611.1 GNAT family N-acetyltransferase [Vibrio fluvialis]UPO64630.1 acetyltransferase [Vibrio fluvialis]
MSIPDDVLEIINAEQELQGGQFYPDQEYLDKISQRAELVIHKVAGKTLGFVFFYCNSESKDFSYITLIATSDAARGQGVGYSLVNKILFLSKQRGFRACRLEVRKSNNSALDFYKRVGFEIIEDRRDSFLMSIAF